MPHPENINYTQVLGALDAQPKRKYLWVVSLQDQRLDAVLAKTFKRPTITFEQMKIDYLNTYRFFAGKGVWQPMDVSFQDPIVPSSAQKFIQWVRLQYQTATGRAGFAAVYKKDITLKMLGPAGSVVQQWQLKGTWLKVTNFGDLDYTDMNTPMQITRNMRFDAAIQQF